MKLCKKTEREREQERQKNRKTDKQTDRHRNRETKRQRKKDKQTDKQTTSSTTAYTLHINLILNYPFFHTAVYRRFGTVTSTDHEALVRSRHSPYGLMFWPWAKAILSIALSLF